MTRVVRFAGMLLVLSAVIARADDDPVVPAGVHYKTASAEVNTKATDIVKKALSPDATDDQIAAMFDEKAVICGPALWLQIKKDPAMAKINGGEVTVVVPITPAGGGAAHDEKMSGKLFQTKDDIKSFAHVLAATSDVKKIKFRKLTTDELKLYWSMISFDITEPVFIAECGKRHVVLQFTSPDDLHVVWIDDLGSYHIEKPTTAPASVPN